MDGTKFLCSASAWLWLSECGGVGSSVFVFPRLQCDSAAFRMYSRGSIRLAREHATFLVSPIRKRPVSLSVDITWSSGKSPENM